MTHDSIGLGEDGPTHQPIEHLASFRAMPNMLMFRPCAGNETAGAYKVAVANRKRPSTIALSRQVRKGRRGGGCSFSRAAVLHQILQLVQEIDRCACELLLDMLQGRV